MFSKPLLGTDTKKTKMSWIEYYWKSCIIQGWYNCWYAFKNWGDLMGDNYQDYALYAIESRQPAYEIFAKLLYNDLSDKEFPIKLGED
jgi:hypothetical protein